MIAWRPELTVLTDLSASMFAACFMILLIFLSLAQDADRVRGSGQPPRIEASRALRVATPPVLRPGEMVTLLRRHGDGSQGIGIDLFADRAEVATGGQRIVVAAGALARGLPPLLGQAAEPPRLYVFANALYNEMLPVLEARGGGWTEMTVPAALRDTARPAAAWSEAFLALSSRPLDEKTFLRELALLLEAGPAPKGQAGGPPLTGRAGDGSGTGAWAAGADLLQRLSRFLSVIAAIAFPATGLAIVLWIERGRLRRVEPLRLDSPSRDAA